MTSISVEPTSAKPDSVALAASTPLAIAFWCVFALYAATLPIEGKTALRNVCLFTLAILFSAIAWRRRSRIEFPLAPAWSLYAAMALISLTYAMDVAYSLSEIRVEILYPLIGFLIAANALRSPRGMERLFWLLAATNLALVAYSLVVAAIGGSTKDGLIGTWNSGVGAYSTYIVMAMPLLACLAWWQRRQGRNWTALALVLLMVADVVDLYFTRNRQSYLALVFELMVVAVWMVARHFSWTRLLLLFAAVATLLAVLAAVQTTRFAGEPADAAEVVKTDSRLQLWRFSVERIGEHPWSGGGFGLRVFQKQFDHLGDDKMLWHAHNMVLNKGIQMGVPGMLVFLVFYCAVPWRMRRGLAGDERVRALALAGIAMTAGMFLKNMTDDFFTRDLAQFFWLLSGALIGSIDAGLRRSAAGA